jgi:hypothetical protein
VASNSALVPLSYGILTGNAANLASGRFDAYNWLEVWVRVAGYTGSAIAQLQFNGDTGTTAYASSVQDNNGAPVTQVAGVASGIKVSATAITGARSLIRFLISNINGRAHGITFTGSDQSEAAATAPHTIIGAGVWATTSQITQITLNDGGGTLLTGTDMAIWGYQGVL